MTANARDTIHASKVTAELAKPKPKTNPWPEALDEAAYHGPAGELVRIIDPATEADPVAVLVSLLAGFGNAAGRYSYFVADGARHYPNLDAVLIGETSKGRKGTAWRRALELLTTTDPEWAANRIMGGLSSGEGVISQVRDPVVVKKVPKKKGKATKGEAADGEGESEYVVDVGVADKRCMIVETEFATALKVMERDGNTLSPILRQAWDGGTLATLTKSAFRATNAHISLLGHITADELRQLLDRTEAANGFGNRILWLCVRRSKLLPEGGYVADRELEGVKKRIADALSFASTEQRLYRNREAGEAWRAVYSELSGGLPGLTGAMLGRAEAQVTRLSLVYALLDCSPDIRVEHLEAALALWEYAKASVEWCFGNSTGDRVADRILDALRAAGADGMTQTEVSGVMGRNVDADRMAQAMSLLIDRELVSRELGATDGAGRKPLIWKAA